MYLGTTPSQPTNSADKLDHTIPTYIVSVERKGEARAGGIEERVQERGKGFSKELVPGYVVRTSRSIGGKGRKRREKIEEVEGEGKLKSQLQTAMYRNRKCQQNSALLK
jgi:hypothetical protein